MIVTKVCPNGVRIVQEKTLHTRAVAIGIWIEAGSRNEQLGEEGIAHFIEHMLFKGTMQRSARNIAEQFDRMGGEVNAFTSKDLTCYYVTVLDDHASEALMILQDMFFHSTFEEEEMNKEKIVILDEMASVEDTPDDDVEVQLHQVMFPNDPLGKPILGNEGSLSSFTKEQIQQFINDHYVPERIVISVAGHFEPSLIAQIEESFGNFTRIFKQNVTSSVPIFTPGLSVKTKMIEQAHICYGYRGLAVGDENIYALSLFDSVLGGTMSSRLFQEIREDRGLAYSVYSYYSSYKDIGLFGIYAGTSPESLSELMDTIAKVSQSICAKGVQESELHNAKEQMKASFLLGLESIEARMHRNGRNEILLKRHMTANEVIEKIEHVSLDEVQQIAEAILTSPYALSVIVPDESVQLNFNEYR